MENSQQFVYEALYNHCIYESSHATLSVHTSLKGAYKAIQKHRQEEWDRWMRQPSWFKRRFKFGKTQDWATNKIPVLP